MIIKRFLAFLIDFIFIMTFSSLVCEIRFLNPNYDKAYSAGEKYYDLLEDVMNNNVDFDNNMITDVIYDVEVNTISNSIIQIVSFVLYYVGFQKWNNGQTIGKKIMKIKVVGKNTDKVSIASYLLRTIILFGLYGEIISIVMIKLCNKDIYLNLMLILNNLVIIMYYVNAFMVILRKDHLGLHDKIAKTRVISI